MEKSDYETLAQFRYLLRTFLAFSGAAAEGAGLRPQQHQAILAIKGFPGRERVTIGELAERLCVRHHSAVGLVDRLVERELVRRLVDPSDRRQVLVEITPKAEAILANLSDLHREELRRLSPVLRQLLVNLEKSPIGVSPVDAETQ